MSRAYVVQSLTGYTGPYRSLRVAAEHASETDTVHAVSPEGMPGPAAYEVYHGRLYRRETTPGNPGGLPLLHRTGYTCGRRYAIVDRAGHTVADGYRDAREAYESIVSGSDAVTGLPGTIAWRVAAYTPEGARYVVEVQS